MKFIIVVTFPVKAVRFCHFPRTWKMPSHTVHHKASHPSATGGVDRGLPVNRVVQGRSDCPVFNLAPWSRHLLLHFTPPLVWRRRRWTLFEFTSTCVNTFHAEQLHMEKTYSCRCEIVFTWVGMQLDYCCFNCWFWFKRNAFIYVP